MPIPTGEPRPTSGPSDLSDIPDQPDPTPLAADALLREVGLDSRAIREILARPGDAGAGPGQE